MPASLIHLGTKVNCVHSGQATPVAPNPRVTLSGQAVVTVAVPFSYTIAGCKLPPLPPPPGPCLTGQFTSVATRVTVEKSAVLLFEGPGICAPTGTLLVPSSAQLRVVGT